jgi:adenylate cyclase
VLGLVLTVSVGALVLLCDPGLDRLSYDLPFLLRKQVPEELVMVYLDAKVKHDLQQPTDQPLDRRFYARLLERLTREHARLVLFDLLFDQPSADPTVDEQFASAMREQGAVVLVADYIKQLQENVVTDAPIPPTPVLAAGAAGYGIATVDDDKADSGIRRIDAGAESHPSASWVAASLLGASITKSPSRRLDIRWLNYYCSPAKLRAVNLDQALEKNGLPEGYFRDKVVVVGARSEIHAAGVIREDAFGNPYSRFGWAFSPGAAVHALSLLNLWRGDWLTRLSFAQELIIVVIWGLAMGGLLMRLSPWSAIGAATLSAVCFAGIACYVQLRHNVWFAWAVPVAAQTPVALVWGIGYRYVIENRRRQRLRRAFSAYLSPYMADRIANSDFDLAPGGKEVEATIMFTDLEGFTKLSESLPPSEVANILISYFNRTTRAIMDQDGTVIKYIGDAVMAVWGAPLPEPKPAERAIIAAWGLNEASKEEMAGRRLRTRIGINTGMVLAGNLGSDVRFDYTLIGDATNVAARLESLNKQLGTDILISESTFAQVSERIMARKLGRFIVAGRSQPVGVCEVLGINSTPGSTPPWADSFSEGREFFVKGDFERAASKFSETIRLRGGSDGPSRFFLQQIDEARAKFEPASWDGVINLERK